MTQPPPDPPLPPAGWPAPAAPPPRRFPAWAKLVIGFGVAAAALVVLVCGGLVYLGLRSPETRALAGSQVSSRHVDTIRRLGLLDPDERIKYFYSDGFLSIEEGMYFFTDSKIVIYGRDLAPPATIVTYDEVADITAEFSDSWLEDGTIWIELHDDSFLAFPISSEGGADAYFFDALVASWQRERGEGGER